jgi:hypothetical protein
MDSERRSNVQHVIVPKSYPVRKVSEDVAREQARRLAEDEQHEMTDKVSL